MPQDKLSLQQALESLGGKHCGGTSWLCPFHDDHNPSADLFESEKGIWTFRCKACGANTKTVIDTMTEKKLFEDKKLYKSIDEIKASIPNLEAAYVYSNPDTRKPELLVIRTVPKSFRQYRPYAWGWITGAPEKLPLYNRTRIKNAAKVVVVEGEKCVHALHSVGFVATTKPAGAQSPEKADWTPLYGKTVYLWPDNDGVNSDPPQKGQQYMRKVLQILQSHCTVYWIPPQGEPKGDDAVDFIAKAKNPRQAVGDLLTQAPLCSPTGELNERFGKIATGQWQNIPWPHDWLTNLTRALLPQTVTLICGEAATGKSLFMSDAMIYWHDNGVRFCVYQLEEDRAYHLIRALAQKVKCAALTNDEWVKENLAICNAHREDQKEWLAQFGRCIWQAPDEPPTLADCAEWVEKRAQEGYRLIIIDPISAAEYTSRHSWLEDKSFVATVKTITRRYNASLILVVHPAKGQAKSYHLDGLAGSASYARLCQTGIWIETVYPSKEEMCLTTVGRCPVEINKKVHILKARNAGGTGRTIGFNFDPETLCFQEEGLLVK